MTEQEAKLLITRITDGFEGYNIPETNRMLCEITSLLKKEVAHKVVKNSTSALFTLYRCPNCSSKQNNSKKPKYCFNCGQQLDWSK